MPKNQRKKISIVGSGHVGSTTALLLSQKALGNLVMIDINEGLAQGLALDIYESSPIQPFDVNLEGTSDYSKMTESDIVVITAGLARKPGMDRLDLLKKNANIVKEISQNIQTYSPNAIIIVVSNPIDLMVYLSYQASQFKKEKVIGMAGVLDSSRMASFVALELGVSAQDVQAMVLGGHGDMMLPIPRYTTVSGIPITELMNPQQIEKINQRTQKGGGEIVNYLKTGSAYYAPAASTVTMIESILKDQKRIIPCSCFLQGEYGIQNIYMGVPAKLGSEGLEKIIQLRLTDQEQKILQDNAKTYEKNIQELKKEPGFDFL